jgi:hypothetical protein
VSLAAGWRALSNIPQAPQHGRDFRSHPLLASRSAGEIEQLPYQPLHLIILAFASVLEDDFSALIENVLRRPILVSIGVPRGVFIVLRD